jgi:hypothetical protein
MSVNKYEDHVFVWPEDDANRQIANGFIQNSNVNDRAIQVLPNADGWIKVVEKFQKNHVSEMGEKFPKRMMVLLIDFDENYEYRFSYVKKRIPKDLEKRVFVLGVLSEPEKLRTNLKKNFENIGESLAKDCSDNTNELWGHALLKHNKDELDRIIQSVKPFLFNKVNEE